MSHSCSSHGRDLSDVRLHYVGRPVAGGSTCPIAEALDASGACLDELWQLVAVDSALNKGLITLRDVAAFTRSSRRRKDFLLANADGRAQSAGETIARLALVVAGHRVCPQAYVPGAGHVDIEVDGMVVVEIDGYEHHHDAKAFRSDRERDRVTVKAGRPVLRYAASEMTSAWRPDIVADVRAALAAWEAGGHRPNL